MSQNHHRSQCGAYAGVALMPAWFEWSPSLERSYHCVILFAGDLSGLTQAIV
jgi:hypothetical protein